MAPPDKRKVIEALLQHLSELAVQATKAANATRRALRIPRPNRRTRKTRERSNKSYLARGQALRVTELNEQIQSLRFMQVRSFGPGDAVAMGALVTLRAEKDVRCLFLAPCGGGIALSIRRRRGVRRHPTVPTGRQRARPSRRRRGRARRAWREERVRHRGGLEPRAIVRNVGIARARGSADRISVRSVSKPSGNSSNRSKWPRH